MKTENKVSTVVNEVAKTQIIEMINKVGNAKQEYVDKVSEFARELRDLDYGDFGAYCCRYHRGKLAGWYAVEKRDDNERCADLCCATICGGGENNNGQYDEWHQYANFRECVEFIDYMSNEYGATAEKALAKIKEKMAFFEE